MRGEPQRTKMSMLDAANIRRDGATPKSTASASPTRWRRRRSRIFSSQGRSLQLLASAVCLFSVAPATGLEEITQVVAPESSLSAGSSHEVLWTFDADSDLSGTTGDLHAFEIELRSCNDTQAADCAGTCGSAYRSLCELNTGAVCIDSDGSYDVVIPEDVEAGTYVFSVTHLRLYDWSSSSSSSALDDSGSANACSESFSIEQSTSTAVLTAKAPASTLQVGGPFTAEWEYEDEGEASGSFQVNLQSCANGCTEDSCGEFKAALCGDEGCYDPGTGDYDVRIPDNTIPGNYKLQVKKASTAAESCTVDEFTIEDDAAADVPATTPAPSTTDRNTVSSPAPIVVATPAPSAAVTPEPSAAGSSDGLTIAPAAGGTPGTPPTPVPPRVTCDPAAVVEYSYGLDEVNFLPVITIAHASGDRDEGGCTNFSGLWEWVLTQDAEIQELVVPADPLTGAAGGTTATGHWLLRSNLDVTNGVMFEVMGTAANGGDSDKVLISSSPTEYFRLRGAGGHLYLYQTEVTSWVEADSAPHDLGADSTGADPRSYITCLSEILEPAQTCIGVAQDERGECRMDVIESVISYLGYDYTESYGLSWKVRGLCEDLSNVDTLFESVRVYGDLQDSEISFLWYGQYSYGHLGGVWTNNILHDNHVYGFDPHDDSDYLTISGNTCFDNGDHGIIASKRCDHLLVENNESYNNGGSGIMLHRSCDDSIVRDNVLYGNFDAGFSLVETSRTFVTGNVCTDNKYGIRLLVGSNDNLITENETENNFQHEVYLYIGSGSVADEPEVPPATGVNERNILDSNIFTGASKFPVYIEDSSETVLSNNVVAGTGAYSFIRANENRLSANTGDVSLAEPFVEDSCFTADSGQLPECV